MRDRELIVHAKLTLTAHRDAVVTLPAALAAAEFEALPLAAASYDKPLVAGGEGSDPTQAAAFNALTRRPDKAARLRKEIERSLSEIATHVDIIAAASKEILEEHDPKKAKKRQQERQDLEIENGECCRSCHRTWSSPGQRRLEPVRDKRGRVTGGTLVIDGESWRLCRWCKEFVLDEERNPHQRLPTIEQVELHHEPGKKVRVNPLAS
jgi:hypothetical protein